MKPKMTVISCLFAILVMTLPMSVPADGDGEARFNSWVSPAFVDKPDPAHMYAVWVVTSPLDFEATTCWGYFFIYKKASTLEWMESGEIYCDGDDGDMQLDWPTVDKPIGAYEMRAYMEVWDESTVPVTKVREFSDYQDFWVWP